MRYHVPRRFGRSPHDVRGRKLLRVGVAVAAILAALSSLAQAERIISPDNHGDATARRTDSGAIGPIGEGEHLLPDLLSLSIGTWKPANPQVDLLLGGWSPAGEFFRLELVFDGLINPPGPCGCCGSPAYEPFRYGPNPVSGYVEIDVDPDGNTGGELEWPELRYLGAAARFGGRPQPAATGERIAVDARAFDGNLATPPFVERSGEDFHLELTGWEIDQDQIERSDLSDWTFGPGETWLIHAYLLHRAHGYSRFSSACCRAGRPLGSYEPLVSVQFSHHVPSARTTVSLVYPLTQAAAASMTGAVPEPMDVLFTNQHSVAEALWELKISALLATSADRALPEFALLAPWEAQDPDAYLEPSAWRVRALLGGSYTTQTDGFFVWSDIFPDVLAGDFNGNGVVNPTDLQAFDAYLLANDANPAIDADHAANASIEIVNFGPGFSLYDVNYDGLIDADDRAVLGGPQVSRFDYDHDGDVDQNDFAHLQVCLSGAGPLLPGCRNADLNHDGQVDQGDLEMFFECVSGPAVLADPACGRP